MTSGNLATVVVRPWRNGSTIVVQILRGGSRGRVVEKSNETIPFTMRTEKKKDEKNRKSDGIGEEKIKI